MIEEVVCQISWCKISCMRFKKDFMQPERSHVAVVKQVWYKNPQRD
jgi:hypothetical protein